MVSTVELLKQLGLNEKETKVYLALLELGSATVQEVADRAGVKRTSIYNFLEELKKLGLVSVIQEKHKTILIAEDPNILQERAREKLEEAKDYTRKIDSVLPELLGLFSLPGDKPRVKFYKGIDGIKKVYDDTLLTAETIYAFADFEKLMTTMDPDYMWKYADKRAEKKIEFWGIIKKGYWAEEAIKKSKGQKRRLKILDVNFDTEINIYGNKVALISFRKPYSGVIVEDRAIAQTLREIWKVMWGKP